MQINSYSIHSIDRVYNNAENSLEAAAFWNAFDRIWLLRFVVEWFGLNELTGFKCSPQNLSNTDHRLIYGQLS